MGSFFSKKKEPEKITKQDKDVLVLKQQRDKLKQYQKKIQENIGEKKQLVEKLLQEGKKKEACLLLARKRYQEEILEKTKNQLENLEKMVQQIQDCKSSRQLTQIEIQLTNVLRQGSEALKKMHEIMSTEDAERIMDETREGIEYQREIDELLTGSLTQEDKDAVLQELEEMTNPVTEKLPEVPTEEPLPEVPSEEPGPKQQQCKDLKTFIK